MILARLPTLTVNLSGAETMPLTLLLPPSAQNSAWPLPAAAPDRCAVDNKAK